jgi:hypothetical protein
MPVIEAQRHVHRRNVVEDVRYDGTEEGATALVAWVRSHGGEAEDTLDGPLVKTQVKWAAVPPGFWVGLGCVRQFWVISGEVHALSYEPAGPDFNAIVDRDTAAAMVVAADELVEQASRSDGFPGRAYGAIEQLRLYVHQLATSCEALR